MTYYDTTKVLDILKNYHIYMANVSNVDNRDYASVGVTVYDEEATLPRANKISDVTANEALKGIDELPLFAQMRTDIKYIDDRLDRVTDNIEILGLRLEGLSVCDISVAVGYSKSHVHRKLVDIAESIIGTNLTKGA